MKKFWTNLNGWKKGGIIGSFLGILFSLLLSINSLHRTSNILIFLGQIFYYMLPLSFIGVVIGLMSDIKKQKNKSFIFYGWLVGVVIGVFILFLAGINKLNTSDRVMFILFSPSYFFSDIWNFFGLLDDYTVAYMGLLGLPFIFGMVGIFLGFIFYLIKRYLKK